MLRPSMSQILKPGESYYEFVVAVARKARDIASKAEAQHEALEEKPVTMAVQLFASGEEKLSDMDVSIERQEAPEDDGDAAVENAAEVE